VATQAARFNPRNILIEDRASGTQLIQELKRDGVYAATRYDPGTMDKIMRLNSVTSTVENGFVYLPERAEWLTSYLHELTTFPSGKYDDQTDSTSQALDWAKNQHHEYGLLAYWRQEAEKLKTQQGTQRVAGPNFRNFHEWRSP
jgi:predicted phage terminase large subunit-like protein